MFSCGGSLSKSRLVLFRQGTAATRTPITAMPMRQQLQQQQQHQLQKVRRMAGGHYMHVSETHTQWGEAFGVVCWLWVFHRARSDLAVMYGFRHPWEHAPDPFAPDHHGHHGHDDGHTREEVWDKFSAKTMKFSEEEDDDEEGEENEGEGEDKEDDDDDDE